MTEREVIVRPGRGDDLAALRQVFRRASWSNEGDRALLVEHPEFLEWSGEPLSRGQTLVAELEGFAVGFISTVPNGDVAEVEDLFVDPDAMRKGVGSALVAHARAQARLDGRRRLEVDGNTHALAFYASVGFVALGPVTLDHGAAVRMYLDVRDG